MLVVRVSLIFRWFFPSSSFNAASRRSQMVSVNFNPGEVLVVGFDQGPRCQTGRGAVDHIAHGIDVIVPFLAVCASLPR